MIVNMMKAAGGCGCFYLGLIVSVSFAVNPPQTVLISLTSVFVSLVFFLTAFFCFFYAWNDLKDGR